MGNETNSITGMAGELGPVGGARSTVDCCCVVEVVELDDGALFSRLLLFWIVEFIGIGWFRVTMGREFGVNVCSGRGGAIGGGADTFFGEDILMRLAPPGGKDWRDRSEGGAKGREWRPFLIGGSRTIANGSSLLLPWGCCCGGPGSEGPL